MLKREEWLELGRDLDWTLGHVREGAISVESTPGEGATFTVVLPVATVRRERRSA